MTLTFSGIMLDLVIGGALICGLLAVIAIIRSLKKEKH